MSIKALTMAVAVVVWAAPAAAQHQRGTMEFGAFGSGASFDNDLSLKTAYGGGGRIGMFLHPRWSTEFEGAVMRATRPNGLADVNVGLLSGRLVFSTPGAFSLLLGAGAGVSTETNFLHSYGVDALVGFKIGMGDNAAFRVDGLWDWLANADWKSYQSIRVGISLFRQPTVRTVEVVTQAPAMEMQMQRPAAGPMRQDSVSAAETRRLRARDAALRALRDSLRNVPGGGVSATDAANMESHIHFDYDKSVLTDSATTVLDEKMRVFRAYPDMNIIIVGHTDMAGTDGYNMALGTRRAQAAKAYLVARGIASNRIEIASAGESQPVTSASGRAAQALNRRAAFRILIAPDGRR